MYRNEIRESGSKYDRPHSTVCFLKISFRSFLPVPLAMVLTSLWPSPRHTVFQTCVGSAPFSFLFLFPSPHWLLLALLCAPGWCSSTTLCFQQAILCSCTASQLPVAWSIIPLHTHLSRLLTGLTSPPWWSQGPHHSPLRVASFLLSYSWALAHYFPQLWWPLPHWWESRPDFNAQTKHRLP